MHTYVTLIDKDIIFLLPDIAINDALHFDWETKFTAPTLPSVSFHWFHRNLVIVRINEDIILQIARSWSSAMNRHYLGIYVLHSDGFSENVEGVIGKSRVKPVPPEGKEKLTLLYYIITIQLPYCRDYKPHTVYAAPLL